jgi:hypothetical membrane protein
MSGSVPIRRLLRHPIANSESLESSALVVGAIVFSIGAVVALVAFWGQSLPISGKGSIGQFVAVGSGLVGIVVFVAARALVASDTRAGRTTANGLEMPGARLRWFDIAALALAHAVIALLGWLAIADLLAKSFSGAVVFPLPVVALGGVGLGVTAYVVFLSAVKLTPMLLSLILAAFLVTGIFASMLSAADPLWWEKNLSTLGMSDDISSLAFNITLIIAGVVVTTIAHYATAAIPASEPRLARGRSAVRAALVVMGVFLACVGVFPVDRYLTAHNVAATGMAIVFVVLVLALPRLVPSISRTFVLLGYVFVGVIVVLAVLFVTGYYNLTAVELVAGLMIFSWLIVFLRTTGATHGSDEVGAASRFVARA